MADEFSDEDLDELVDRLVNNIRKGIDEPEPEGLPSLGLRPFDRTRESRPRDLQLIRDFKIFRETVWLLRAWDRKTMPGIYFKNGSLPASPQNPRLLLSNDPVSRALREAWEAHRERRTASRRDHADEGSVIELPLEESTNAFSNGFAATLLLTGISGSPGVIHFTVNSRNHGYRIHVTEQYWYNPVVFGSKLSKPVDDMLYPADYRFGGQKAGGSIIWDSGIHTASASRSSTMVTSF